MPIAFVGAQTATTGGPGTGTVDRPASVAEGHVLIATVIDTGDGVDTAPSGFTSIRQDTSGSITVESFVKAAGPSEPSDYTFTTVANGGDLDIVLTVYSGVDTASPVNVDGADTGSGTVLTASSITTTDADVRVLALFHLADTAALSDPSDITVRVDEYTGTVGTTLAVDYDQPSAGATGDKTSIASVSGDWATHHIALTNGNDPPNAPNQTNPVGSQTFDRTTTERFTWDFSDPDDGDSQSKFDLQIRPQGSGTLEVDTSGSTPNEYYDLAGGTLADGAYEWRVRTYDALGVQGPWSGWEPFSALDAPAPPTITDPTGGSTIPADTYVVRWSAPEQAAYQLRRVADDGGSPDISDVLFDTGTFSSTARLLEVSFPSNNQWEHVQVRVRYDGLWSDWASVRVEVSFTEPATPTVTVVEDDPQGALSVLVDNGDWPVVVSPPTYDGTGDGTLTGPTATDGTTGTHSWQAECVATAADGGTFDVTVDGTVVGQATVGAEFTYEGLSFTINDGATDFTVGDTFTWSTTAVKVTSNELWRRQVDDTGDGIRVATEVARNSSFVDWAVASGVGYAFRARAQGDNQTTAWGAWTEEPSDTDGGSFDGIGTGTLDGGSL